MTISTGWVNLVAHCNNQCIWCYAKDSTVTQQSIMPFEKAVAILDWLVSINCRRCILIGGEPTLHPKFTEIFRYGKSRGMEMHIATNGRRFSSVSFCESLVSVGLKTGDITISMHATSADDSRSLTGSAASFMEFESGLTNLMQLGVIPSLTGVISKPLVGKLDGMLMWAREHGLKNMSFNLGMPAVSSTSVDSSFTLPPSQLGNEVLRLYKMGKQLGLKTAFLFSVPFCVLPRQCVEELLADGALHYGCHIRTGCGILFNVEGDLVMCNHLLDMPVRRYAEMKEVLDHGDFSQFWGSDAMQSVREAVCVYRTDHCRDCDLESSCHGGCPILWVHNDPKLVIKGWS